MTFLLKYNPERLQTCVHSSANAPSCDIFSVSETRTIQNRPDCPAGERAYIGIFRLGGSKLSELLAALL